MLFEKCSRCGAYGYVATHQCEPDWEVSRYEDVDFAKVVYAIDARRAAEKCVELHHVDYDYSSEVVVFVRPKGRSLEWKRFVVEVRAVPEAHAYAQVAKPAAA